MKLGGKFSDGPRKYSLKEYIFKKGIIAQWLDNLFLTLRSRDQFSLKAIFFKNFKRDICLSPRHTLGPPMEMVMVFFMHFLLTQHLH